MSKPLAWNLPIERLPELPARLIAGEMLRHVPSVEFVRSYLIDDALRAAGARSPHGSVYETKAIRRAYPEATLALVEAFAELERDGLVVAWPPPHADRKEHLRGGQYTLTRLGREMQLRDDVVTVLDARRRIGVELHPYLARKLRAEVAVGAFESATTVALRTIEGRIRDLCETPLDGRGNPLSGVPLMQYAFRTNGPLADTSASAGEQVGVMQLFAGTFGAVRNLLAHNEVDWPDPTEAAEYILLADLLMRIVDRAAARR